jgi:hypothetical protein
MAKLTKADAARQLGISRTTLYKLIDQGRVSATPDGMIDTAELVRVASTVHAQHERPRTPQGTGVLDTQHSSYEHTERPVYTSSEHREQVSGERQLTSTYHDLVDILREQLQAAQARERAYQEHIERLTLMLHEAQQRSDRLLDTPRSAPAPPGRVAVSEPSAPQGDMRRRIVALLREHPDGLSPVQTRHLLGIEKDLGDTIKAMARDGLLRRIATGVYTAREAGAGA